MKRQIHFCLSSTGIHDQVIDSFDLQLRAAPSARPETEHIASRAGYLSPISSGDEYIHRSYQIPMTFETA